LRHYKKASGNATITINAGEMSLRDLVANVAYFCGIEAGSAEPFFKFSLVAVEAMTITPEVSLVLVVIRADGFRTLDDSLGLVGTIKGVVVADTTSRTALASLGRAVQVDSIKTHVESSSGFSA
jgi:hypothetical protein